MAKTRRKEENMEENIEENIDSNTSIVKINTKKNKKSEEVIDIPVIKNLTMKQSFLKNIQKQNFSIFQNGKLIYTHDLNTIIKTSEKYFEINGKKYTYFGIEIKYA